MWRSRDDREACTDRDRERPPGSYFVKFIVVLDGGVAEATDRKIGATLGPDGCDCQSQRANKPDVLPSGLGDLGGATGAALLGADAPAVHA